MSEKIEIKAIQDQVKNIITPQQDILNIVLEGGGVKGAGLAAAYIEWCQHNDANTVKRVAGSSAGGIIALLISLGYSSKELKQELDKMDFKAFQDQECKTWNEVFGISKIPIIGKSLGTISGTIEKIIHIATTKEHGIYKGDFFTRWVEKRIFAKLGNKNATFEDLHAVAKHNPRFKDLFVTGSNLSDKKLDVFSHEDPKFSKVRLADAVRATMAFPGAFKGIVIKGKFYVDGGLINNCPVDIFEKKRYYAKRTSAISKSSAKRTNPATIGFKVDSKDEMHGYVNQNSPIHMGLMKYAASAIDSVLQDKDKLDDYNIIQVYDEGIDTMDFHMSKKMKQKLEDSGANAATIYQKQINKTQDKIFAKTIRLHTEKLQKIYKNLGAEESVIISHRLQKEIEPLAKRKLNTEEQTLHNGIQRHIDEIAAVYLDPKNNPVDAKEIIARYEDKQAKIKMRDSLKRELYQAKSPQYMAAALTKICSYNIKNLTDVLKLSQEHLKNYQKEIVTAREKECALWESLHDTMPRALEIFIIAHKGLHGLKQGVDAKEIRKLTKTLAANFEKIPGMDEKMVAKKLLLKCFKRSIKRFHDKKPLHKAFLDTPKTLLIEVNRKFAAVKKKESNFQKDIKSIQEDITNFNAKIVSHKFLPQRIELLTKLNALYNKVDDSIIKATGVFAKTNRAMTRDLSQLSWPNYIFRGFEKTLLAAPWCVGSLLSSMKNQFWKQSDYKYIAKAQHLLQNIAQMRNLFDSKANILDSQQINRIENFIKKQAQNPGLRGNFTNAFNKKDRKKAAPKSKVLEGKVVINPKK